MFAVFSYTRAGVYTRTRGHARAAASSTLNFQARLLSASGGVVPDGSYSITFNLYNVSSGGSTQWAETQSLTTKNGYLSVYLGSSTPFPGTIDWSQEQWLTMNVNGDGEMTPRIKLTAVPFAFAAESLIKTNGGNKATLSWLTPTANRTITLPDADGTVALSSGGTFANNGVLYGNGTSVIQSTAAGNTGQCLVATTGAAPSWSTCTSTMQGNYDNSSNPQITLNSTQGKITIQDNATPLSGNLLEVTSNGGATKYLAVSSTGVSTSGTLTSGSTLTVTSGGASISGGLNNNTGGITNAGNITGVGANITASGALTIASDTTNAITIDSGTTGAVNVGTGANSKAITIGNTSGTSSLTLNSGTGNIDIGTGAQARTVNIATGAAAQNLVMGSTNTTSATTLQAGTGGIQLSTGGNVNIGAVDSNANLLVVDVKNTTGDPAGTDGAIYYNSFLGKFRCYENGAWANCIGGSNYSGTSASFLSGLQNVPANVTGATVETLVFTSATAVSNTAGVTGFTAPADGSFRTCLVKNNAAITAGTLGLRWRVNGVSVGSPACQMDSTNNRQAASALNPGVVSFSAGDTIGIAFDTSAGFLPAATNDFTAYWTVEYSGSGGGGGSNGGTLQDAYDNSVAAAILTGNNKDIEIDLADTAIDSNFVINVEPGGDGKFKFQNSGTDVFSINKSGEITTSGSLTLGNTATAVAGTIRWTGLDFEGFDGASWLSLTSGSGGAGLGSNYVNVVKQTNEVVNNSITPQDDNELKFSIGPNEEWTYRFVVQANAATAADLRFVVTAPTGATCQVSVHEAENAESDAQRGCGVSSAVMSGNAAAELYEITGTVKNGSNAGTVTLQWAQFTLNASDATVYAGSYLNAFRSIGSGGAGQPFVQNGNSFGLDAILGTSDNNDLRLITNNTEQLTILANGNVGVGDTSPAALFTVGTGDALQVNSSGDLSTSGTVDIGGLTTLGSNLVGSGSATGVTASATAAAGVNTTTINLTGAAFANNDVIFINNAGQDYYTRIVSGGGTATLTVSPAVNYDASATIEKYNVQNIGATSSDYTTQANRFFQGFFLGGVVTGAGSTTLSDGNLTSTGTLTLQRGGGQLTIGGNVDVAGTLTGDASGLTNINAAAITGSISGLTNLSLSGTISGGTTITGTTINGTTGINTGAGSGTQRVDNIGNLVNIAALTLSGAISGGTSYSGSGNINTTSGVIQTNSTDRIDNSGNLVNIGNLTATGATTLSSGSTGTLTLKTNNQSAASTASAGLIITSGNASGTGGTSNSGNVTIDSGTSTNGTTGLVQIGTSNTSGLTLGRSGITTTVGGTLVINGSNASVGTTSTAGSLTLSDGSSNTGLIQTTALGSNRTYTLPDASGTVCLDGNNCSFVQLGAATIQTDSSTNPSIGINKTGASGNILTLQKNGTGVFTIANGGATQISVDSATALQIRNAAGTTNFFTVSTSGNSIQVGNSTGDATGILFILDAKTGADPSGTNGGLYYNSTDNKFRCYEGGVWKDCTGNYIRSFIDTTSDAAVDANTTNYWDLAAENNNSYPNISLSQASGKAVMGIVTMEMTPTSNADTEITGRVERGIGSAPTCGSGTQVGGNPGVFSTNTGAAKASTVTFIDTPNTTSTVYYVFCSDSSTVGTNGNITRIRVTLQEVSNSN